MQVYEKISRAKFMSRHDLVFTEIPHIWYEAPFLGNGFMGATLCFSEDNKEMYINLGHTCVYDNRKIEKMEDEQLYLTPRLPIGKIAVGFKGEVTGVNLRLDIYNARLSGSIETTEGSVGIDCLIFNDSDCLLFEHSDSENESVTFRYIPSNAESPRYNAGAIDNRKAYEQYGRARKSQTFSKYNMSSHLQPYYCGGGFCVSYAEADSKFFVSVVQGEELKNLVPEGLGIIKNAIQSVNVLILRHIEWWNKYFDKSFISMDDGVYESFIYIQLYKLACAGRENGRPFDTCGPWLTDNTRWPGCWWNLNVELTISPLYVSNHIELAHCVNNALKNGMQQLIDNVPEEYRADCAALGRDTTSTLYAPVTTPGNIYARNCEREAGNLIWTLYYIWQEYRMTGERALLTDIVYPLLKRAVKYYSYFLYMDKYGRYHLKSTISPEYMKADSPDVNYDLALLRWGCKTLMKIDGILNIDDPDKKTWNRILLYLCDYPQSDDEGMFIAATTPYAESHRHYSHLLAFYPLHLLSENKKPDRLLVEKSIKFWQSKPEALLGYSQSGAASMYAMLGDGNKAIEHLERLWKGFITPNTMYHEGGNPVIETPPSAATAILEMLIQSHNGYIDLFPALPDNWKNVCFDKLLCYDGFEVSAKLTDGKVEWVMIKSNRGKPCKIKADFISEPQFCNTNYKILNDGKYFISVEKNETAILSTVPSPIVEAVNTQSYTTNCYGLNTKNKMFYDVEND